MKRLFAPGNDLAPYLLGITIIYVGCFMLPAVWLSTVFGERILNGLIFGTLLCIPLGAINVFLQFFLRRYLRKLFELRRSVEIILLNVIPLAFLVYVLWGALSANWGEEMFKLNVANPVPPSVNIIDYGYSVSIPNGGWAALKFEIDHNDLIRILTENGCTLAKYDTGHIPILLRNRTAVPFQLQKPFPHYTSITNRIEKHFMFNTNSPLVYFLSCPGP